VSRTSRRSAPVEVDDVVEVARTCALSEGSQLLGEDLDEGVAADRGVVGEHIVVGVGDRSTDRLLDEDLVVGEVELDARLVRIASRSAVVDPALGRAPIGSHADERGTARQRDASLLLDGIEHRGQGGQQCGRLEWAVLADGEVEVFGESVRLDEALLEAGATLEDPRVAQRCVRPDAPEEPAEDVVLLDDLLGQPPLSCAAL
jgi:hypothetical protein